MKKPDLRVDVFDREEHEFGIMPPPLHFGRYQRDLRSDFQLPHDLCFMRDLKLLKPLKPPSPKYRKISKSMCAISCSTKPVQTSCYYSHVACRCLRQLTTEEARDSSMQLQTT